jgi:glucan phosphoethanolaminetransferase (alkaline phosphatase superfamily)
LDLLQIIFNEEPEIINRFSSLPQAQEGGSNYRFLYISVLMLLFANASIFTTSASLKPGSLPYLSFPKTIFVSILSLVLIITWPRPVYSKIQSF